MDADDWLARGRSFERGADDYERLRPEFPAQLFDDVCESAGARIHGRVLEVGAGTGRATLPLVRRSATIDVVEPSADMLGILAARLEAAGLGDRCRLRQAVFEDVDPGSTYDVVVAAQSFHWTQRETRWTRLSSLLRAGGRAYLFWNGWHLASEAHDVDAVRRLFADRGHGLLPDVEDHRTDAGWAESEIDAEPGLRLLDVRLYAWPWHLPVDDYLGLLRTTSQYAVAAAGVREPLLTSLRGLLGDRVTLHGGTRLLCLADGQPGPDR